MDQHFDSDSLYSLRAAVAAHATQVGMAQLRVYDVVSAVHELAANAVRHGAGHGTLSVWALDGTLYCEVSDAGPASRDGFGTSRGGNRTSRGNGQLAVDPGWPTQRGHGLWLVRQVADATSLGSGPSGTVATVCFDIPSPGTGAPAGLPSPE